MRHPTPQSPLRRTAAALLIASLIAPAALAQLVDEEVPAETAASPGSERVVQQPTVEEPTPAETAASPGSERVVQQPTVEEPTPAEVAPQPEPAPQAEEAVRPAEAASETEAPAPAEATAEAGHPAQSQWYDGLTRNSAVGADLLVVRPLSAVTLIAGGALFVPAALMTAPNGMDSVRDAYDRFVREPGEYFYARPLGEF